MFDASEKELFVVTRRSRLDSGGTVEEEPDAMGALTVDPVVDRKSLASNESANAPEEAGATEGHRTYVIDTSVLLSDPWALTKFAEHEVVLPLIVISELEAKRHHPELGYFARQALRLLDDLQDRTRSGWTGRFRWARTAARLHVELNHTDPVRPAGRIPQRQQRLSHPGLCA